MTDTKKQGFHEDVDPLIGKARKHSAVAQKTKFYKEQVSETSAIVPVPLESVLLSRSVIAKIAGLKNVVQNTDQPTINDIVQAMVSDYQILEESEVALIFNGFGYEMINRKKGQCTATL
jgi:hypothetical protein